MKKYFILISIMCFCLCVTEVAKAETISNSGYIINEETQEGILGLYYNSQYSNYILTSYRENNNYNYYTYYYLCLFDEKIENYDSSNINTKCDVLYTLYNNTISLKNNTTLSVKNSVYYSSNKEKNKYDKFVFTLFMFGIFIVVSIMLICSLDKLFCFRGGGLKYEDI